MKPLHLSLELYQDLLSFQNRFGVLRINIWAISTAVTMLAFIRAQIS